MASWLGLCLIWAGGLLMSLPAQATQDDVPLLLAPVDALFSGNPDTGVKPLSAGITRIQLARYVYGGEDRLFVWDAALQADIALLAAQDFLIWRMGLSMQTVADDRNDIHFRLSRLFYDATSLVEMRAGVGIFRLGYRHRCSHGADTGEGERILIRSGFEVGYLLQHQMGPTLWLGSGLVQWTVIGQNPDSLFQTRGQLVASSGVQVDLVGGLKFVSSAGLGAMLVGQGEEYFFGGLTTPIGPAHAEWLPAAAVGLAYHDEGPTGRVMIEAKRTLDTGLTETTLPANFVAFRVEIGW
jgi:hypothetical protein